VLAELLAVIDARGAAMVGRSRLHEPSPGEPLHVLVIDELAALTAYADPDTRRDASRLLSEVLTQGRALGVVVVALVQDPRKDTVSMRGLFTQTVALRLRSPEETRMVLGDGMAALAPAHRISPAAPGTGYVVGDDGTVDLVRADWWSDELVRQVAEAYPAALPVAAAGGPTPEVADVAAPVAISDRPRKPRSPRTSRRLAPVVLDDQVAP
jgi:S-DNA-T family DNA segregation ATPase FtsK/SpoIIIE